MISNLSPLDVPNCIPPLTKKAESELTLLAISDNSLLLNLSLKRSFNPTITAVPLLDPPPRPAFVGIIFLIEMRTLGMLGYCALLY